MTVLVFLQDTMKPKIYVLDEPASSHMCYHKPNAVPYNTALGASPQKSKHKAKHTKPNEPKV